MCDETTFQTDDTGHAGVMSRRRFGVLSSSAAVASLLPRVANAKSTVESEVKVSTPDGDADAYFVHPAEGKYPAVLIWPDIFGLRPAFRLMAKRLAETGYAVLAVNPYYRSIPAPVELPNPAELRAPENWQLLRSLAGTLTPATTVTDAKAFVAFLDGQAAVDTRRKIGTTGYCMGGPLVMRTAAALPERIGAGATFHGSRMVTADPSSPHLLISQSKAGFLIAISEDDDEKDPDAKDVLSKAFEAAKLHAEIEVYEGAMHGWCPPDSYVYNMEAAERAWTRMLVLFEETLG